MSLWPEIAAGEFALRYCDAGGIRTRYVEAGFGHGPDAEAVVFVHGTGGHLEAFNRNLFPHAEHMRVFALDMIGHGFSSKPDHPYEIRHYVKHLLDFCNAKGLKRIHVHGESLGGWIAAQFAIDHPERTAKLVLNTAGGLNSDPVTLKRVYEVTKKAVAEATLDSVRARLQWLVHNPADISDDLVELRYRIYTQPGFTHTIEHILCLTHMERRLKNVLTEATLAKISAPTLIIWTEHDPTGPVEVGKRFHAAIKGSKFVVMNGCAHWPQWEKADEFNALHLDFLRG